jgi:hypothetical protein
MPRGKKFLVHLQLKTDFLRSSSHLSKQYLYKLMKIGVAILKRVLLTLIHNVFSVLPINSHSKVKKSESVPLTGIGGL